MGVSDADSSSASSGVVMPRPGLRERQSTSASIRCGASSGRFSSRGTVSVALACGSILGAVALGAVAKAQETLPDGVQQLLPRGRIAAVFEPEFVEAAHAQISDDAWVLGVLIDGEARAYSLNLLNRHEVVNDQIGGSEFAAVW